MLQVKVHCSTLSATVPVEGLKVNGALCAIDLVDVVEAIISGRKFGGGILETKRFKSCGETGFLVSNLIARALRGRIALRMEFFLDISEFSRIPAKNVRAATQLSQEGLDSLGKGCARCGHSWRRVYVKLGQLM